MLFDTRRKMPLLMGLALIVATCGPSLDGQLADEAATEETVPRQGTNQETASQPERVEVPVQILLDRGDGLGLTDVTAAVSYSVSLAGCASGFTETSSTTLAPYTFDEGCYARLTNFVYDGTDNFTYDQVAAGASPFTDSVAGYAAGQQAVFATADGGAAVHQTLLRVYVETQLSNPIAPGDSVVYRFSHIERGADETILKSTIDQAGTTVTVSSVAPPSFTISTSTLVDITATGAGEWEFLLQCTAAISGAGDDRVCEEVDMFDDLRFMLVEDTFGSDPTVTELETAFGVLAGSGSPLASGDLHNAATSTVNGGFKTPDTGEANVATGPAQMHLNPNMILILRSEDPGTPGEFSWQYFNVDVDVNN